jgi:Tol biopolymer transport system component
VLAGCEGAPTIPLLGKPAATRLTALDASRGLAGTIYFAHEKRIWRLRGGSLSAVTPAGAVYAYPAVTVDGTTTAAAYIAPGESGIAFGGPDFAGLHLSKPLPRDPHSGSLDLKPAFSPDGNRVVMMSDRARGYTDESIWEGAVTGGLHQVSFPPDASGGDDAPAYLADGSAVIFVAWRQGHAGLAQASVPFGRPRTLVTATDHDFLDPAPGPGNRLAYAQRQGEAENIFLGEVDGSGGRPLTSFNDARQPAWSPDGKSLLFISPHAGSFDLWMVPASGGSPVQLTTGGDLDANSRPAWSGS